MISAERIAHWNIATNRAPREEHDLTDSLPFPFQRIEYLFTGKDVLEIGPGRGRQYERLKAKVKDYSICDIAPDCLKEKLFLFCRHRFLLKAYADDFNHRFAVVHFWYVLHHIKLDELPEFFAFVARHLQPGGVVLFNTPQTGNAIEWYKNDGLGTTRITPERVLTVGAAYFDFFLRETVDHCSTGECFYGTKKG